MTSKRRQKKRVEKFSKLTRFLFLFFLDRKGKRNVQKTNMSLSNTLKSARTTVYFFALHRHRIPS